MNQLCVWIYNDVILWRARRGKECWRIHWNKLNWRRLPELEENLFLAQSAHKTKPLSKSYILTYINVSAHRPTKRIWSIFCVSSMVWWIIGADSYTTKAQMKRRQGMSMRWVYASKNGTYLWCTHKFDSRNWHAGISGTHDSLESKHMKNNAK